MQHAQGGVRNLCTWNLWVLEWSGTLSHLGALPCFCTRLGATAVSPVECRSLE